MTDSAPESLAGEVRSAGDCALLVIPPQRGMVVGLAAALRVRPAGWWMCFPPRRPYW